MEQTIERADRLVQTTKHGRWALRLCIYLLTVVASIAFWIWIAHMTVAQFAKGNLWFQVQVAEAKETAASWLDLRPLEVLVEPDKADVQKLIEVISKEEGVHPHITLAMAHQESGSKLRTDRVRFEPHLMPIFKNRIEGWMSNDIEKQMVASSHGLMQVVYGWHRKTCSLESYTQLYQPSINIRCGLRVLKASLAGVPKTQGKLTRLREALAIYNGGSRPPKASYVYADSILKRYVELVIEDSGEAI